MSSAEAGNRKSGHSHDGGYCAWRTTIYTELMRISGLTEIIAWVLFVKSRPLPFGMGFRHRFACDCAAPLSGPSTTGWAFNFEWVQHHFILRLTRDERPVQSPSPSSIRFQSQQLVPIFTAVGALEEY